MYNYTFGNDGQRIADMYPPIGVDGVDNRPRLSELVSDLVFHCDNNQVAHALASTGAAPWMYSFRHRPKCAPFGFGAAHASEIVYVFNNFAEVYDEFHVACTPSSEDMALAKRMGSL